MSKAVAEVEGQTIEIDTAAMEKRLNESFDQKWKKYLEQLKEYKPEPPKQGKGIIEAYVPDIKERNQKVVEEFHKGENCDPKVLKEQWTIAIPAYAAYELAGHMRDFVWVTEQMKGKPGDTVNIPYVKDVEFTHASPAGTGAFSGKTGLVAYKTTTMHESGEYYDAYYYDIEKVDANLLEELNRVFAHAAIRAEDYDLLALLDACTSAQFSSASGLTLISGSEEPDCGTVTATYFHASFIADALGKMLRKGKEIRPGDCILYMTPRNYRDLLKEVLASVALAYARNDVITTGMIEQQLGVKIVVGGYKSHHAGHTTSTYEVSYLMRPKRCLALAPKRDILIETDKIVKTRQLTITASHTYGVCLLDATEANRIWSSYKWKSAFP